MIFPVDKINELNTVRFSECQHFGIYIEFSTKGAGQYD